MKTLSSKIIKDNKQAIHIQGDIKFCDKHTKYISRIKNT